MIRSSPGECGALAFVGTLRASLVQHSAFLERTRYPSLDGLRCLAIVPVVFHHSTPRPLPGLLGQGPLGVHLFFALSGFLITSLLLAEERKQGAIDLRRFYVRRSLRIFPLYYAVLGLYVLRAVFFMAPSAMRSDFLHDVPFFATYTANVLVDYDVPHPVVFAFAWSLSTEEQFYAAWPPLLRVVRSAGFRILAALAFLSLDLAAERGLLRPLLGDGVLLRAVTSISAPMCLGVLGALLLAEERSYGRVNALLGRRASTPVVLTALGALVAGGAPLLAIHVAMAALVVSVVVSDDGGLRALLESRVARHVGAVSYGIYLLHVAVITGVKAFLPESLRDAYGLVFVLALPLSVLVATLSYRWFETPFLRLRDRFRSAGAG